MVWGAQMTPASSTLPILAAQRACLSWARAGPMPLRCTCSCTAAKSRRWVGVRQAAVAPELMLAILMQGGKPAYMSYMRNRHVELCALRALLELLILRFVEGSEAFPDPRDPEDWCVRGKGRTWAGACVGRGRAWGGSMAGWGRAWAGACMCGSVNAADSVFVAAMMQAQAPTPPGGPQQGQGHQLPGAVGQLHPPVPGGRSAAHEKAARHACGCGTDPGQARVRVPRATISDAVILHVLSCAG